MLAGEAEIAKRPINVYAQRQTPIAIAAPIDSESNRWADPIVEEPERWDGMS